MNGEKKKIVMVSADLEIIFRVNFESRAEYVAGDEDVMFLVVDSDSIHS